MKFRIITWTYVFGSSILGHINGPPPSPVHVSTPCSPPAHKKDSRSLKSTPRRVVFSNFSHLSESTNPNSTCFSMFWYNPASPTKNKMIQIMAVMYFNFIKLEHIDKCSYSSSCRVNSQSLLEIVFD